MIVNVAEFLEVYTSKNYGHGSYIPRYIYNIIKCEPSAFAELPDDSIDKIESNKSYLEYRDNEYAEISFHRLKGIEYEESGNNSMAIMEYQKAVKIGLSAKNDMTHAYKYCTDRINSLSKLNKISNE